MRLTRIYTKTGDDGTTSLGNGERIRKDSPWIEVFGTLDELNSSIGMARACGLSRENEPICKRIQNELLDLGGELILDTCTSSNKSFLDIGRSAGKWVVAEKTLENEIDGFLKDLGPLEEFIIPGGCQAAAQLHVCRCVCRRLERGLASSSLKPTVDRFLPYVNRLSDLLFVLARYENLKRGIEETLWQHERS